MRAVSRATWTSGEPVSPSWEANLWITSDLASLVRVTAKEGSSLGPWDRVSGLGGDLAGLGDVRSHLALQLLGGVELDLVPQALEERRAAAGARTGRPPSRSGAPRPAGRRRPRRSAARRC